MFSGYRAAFYHDRHAVFDLETGIHQDENASQQHGKVSVCDQGLKTVLIYRSKLSRGIFF
jgi:hypothetical protein